MRAAKVWIAGFWWVRYVIKGPPGPLPPLWAIRWVMAGTQRQRQRLIDRIDVAVRRVRR